MFNKFFSTVIVAASLGFASNASAAVIGIESDCNGTGTGLTGSFTCGASGRHDVSNIEIFENGIVSGDDDFFSLGLGGTLVIEFNPVVKGPAMAIEITTGGASSSHDEAVELYGSNDGTTFTFLGTANNQTGINDGTRGTKTSIAFSGTYAFLGLKDVSQSVFAGTASTDGYDIDAIAVSAVPLPASALLLFAGVAGLGSLRARRKS